MPLLRFFTAFSTLDQSCGVENMQINPKEFFAFVKEYLNEYGAEQELMHLNIKLSKGGKFYITVDEYKAEGRGSNQPQAQQPAKSSLPWENW